jgi:cysteinyl-tRNA synthetase
VLSAALDKQFGSGVKDHAIFQAHARRFEKEFMEDMQSLGVRDPDAITHVSEYVPQIIEFIKRIEKAGNCRRVVFHTGTIDG